MFATLSLLAAVTTMLQTVPARAAAGAARAAAAAPEEPALPLSALRAARSAALAGVTAPTATGVAFATLPRAGWADADPGDSLYRAARQLLNRSRYAEAAAAFSDLIKRYPRSGYAPDAYYWAAFALYRTGDDANLRQATTLLETQASRYPRAATRGDGDALLARAYGELARRGDSDAAQWVQAHAAGAAGADSARATQTACPSEDDDPRIAAMNALMQMDAANAVPVIQQVLARRDPCSVELRRKAVFVLSQKRSDQTEDILLSVARSDPDADVRGQAVFWLSQVGSDKAVTALDSILRTSNDEELRDKAIFALSQIHGPRSSQILRDYAARENASEDTREKAVFWLGQQHGGENAAFLRDLYGRVTPDDLKEKIIFSLSQMRSAENTRWLMDLAVNSRENVDLRKKALFWAGQTGADIGDLTALYDRTSDRDIKEQLIFVYSQRHQSAALDKLIDIARHEQDKELRKKAVFWLGQSHDPRAAQVLLEIINQ
jgi:HEAT repeat protein